MGINECDYSNIAAVFREKPLVIGEAVAALGNSQGTMFRCSVGVISQVISQVEEKDKHFGFNVGNGVKFFPDYVIIHDATIIGGNSGGPLVDREGRLLGLNTLVLETDEGDWAFGFSIAIGYKTIQAAMAEVGIL